MQNIIFSLLLFFIILSTAAGAQDSITWMEADAPPFFIKSGAYKNQGYGDMVTDILTQYLPEYRHEHMYANLSRHYYSFKQGKNVCSAGLYRTPEREQFLYFSIPSFFTLPTVLVIRKDRFKDFGGNRIVSLADILTKDQLILGREKKRSYGKAIDAILNKDTYQNHIFTFEGVTFADNFFKMLKMKRIDALICLPEEAIYHAELLGIKDQIMTLTIKENQIGYESWLSSVGCSKTPWGKEVITKINSILLEQRPTDLYKKSYERWLDAGSLQHYQQLYNTVFIKTTPPGTH